MSTIGVPLFYKNVDHYRRPIISHCQNWNSCYSWLKFYQYNLTTKSQKSRSRILKILNNFSTANQKFLYNYMNMQFQSFTWYLLFYFLFSFQRLTLLGTYDFYRGFPINLQGTVIMLFPELEYFSYDNFKHACKRRGLRLLFCR